MCRIVGLRLLNKEIEIKVMRNYYKMLFVFFYIIKAEAQKSDTFNSMEFNENVSTQNNTTQINLFNIDFNGEKIPITLKYNHSGNLVNQTPNSTGIGWNMENIGKITRIINDKLDEQPEFGWFNSEPFPFIFSSMTEYFNCVNEGSSKRPRINCPTVPSGFSGYDLSPDYFNVYTSNGVNFDFVYEKEMEGSILTPKPVILSNYKDYLIDTNFNNFPTSANDYFVDLLNNDFIYWPTAYFNTVFKITDTNGDVYDFINGPLKQDINRSSAGLFRNDYYLYTLKNPSKSSEELSISYRTTLLSKREYFSSGHNSCPSNNCTDNKIENLSGDYYFVSENRYDISQINSNKAVINFFYNNEDYLTEVEVKDNLGNYITGYLFSYLKDAYDRIYLHTIEKYNNDKSVTELLYTFEYYDTPIGFSGELDSDVSRINRDYFGYFNSNVNGNNLFPFDVVLNNSTGLIQVAADLNPNLNFAKYYSLKKIINKYKGITEFDYRLKTDTCVPCFNSTIYGGGLVVDSKKIFPNTGKDLYIKYNYENLIGNVIDYFSLKYHYGRSLHPNFIAWSSKPVLLNTESYYTQNYQSNEFQRMGSFYKKITESTFDLGTMSLLSKTITEFVPDLEGIFFSPRLVKQEFLDPSNFKVKESEYFYSTSPVETIEKAIYRSEIRDLNPGLLQVVKISFLENDPINIKKVNLIEKREKAFSSTSFITNSTFLNYVNPNSNLIRSKINITSTGNSIEERFFYAKDSEVENEPNINFLQLSNRVETPIKKETFYGTEKVSESKMVYGKDATTSNLVLPKNIIDKKGNDVIGVSYQIINYDLYDDQGNLLQYTQENGIPVIMIWGYNKSKLIVKIENASYSSLSSNTLNLIIAAQNASNITNNESSTLAALNSLRADSALVNSMITTCTHIPLVGVYTMTDPKGDRVVYHYDKFGKLVTLRDKSNNIILESDYNYKP